MIGANFYVNEDHPYMKMGEDEKTKIWGIIFGLLEVKYGMKLGDQRFFKVNKKETLLRLLEIKKEFTIGKVWITVKRTGFELDDIKGAD